MVRCIRRGFQASSAPSGDSLGFSCGCCNMNIVVRGPRRHRRRPRPSATVADLVGDETCDLRLVDLDLLDSDDLDDALNSAAAG